MHFRDINQTDIELQKDLLLVALWTPLNEPDQDPDVLELPHMKEYYDQSYARFPVEHAKDEISNTMLCCTKPLH